MIEMASPEASFTPDTRTVPKSVNSLGSVEEYICVLHLTKERAVDDLVPICCFCSKVRDDTNMDANEGSWVDLNTYAIRRQLPLSHRFVFTHGYCPDCIAHFDERLAAYRQTTVWESSRETARRLIAGAEEDRRVG